MDKDTIARKVLRLAALLVLFLILAIAFLLRMQYIIMFGQQTEETIQQQALILSQALSEEDFSDTEQLRTLCASSNADTILLLAPDTEEGICVINCLGSGSSYDSDLLDAAVCGKPSFTRSYQLGFGVFTYVNAEHYQPVVSSSGKVRAVLMLRCSAYCPLLSHTSRHVLIFLLAFLIITLVLLRYHTSIRRVFVTPLENVKEKACDLTKGNEAFDFMDKTGNELEIIYQAFEILRDRQQRLDESLDYAREIQSRILPKQQELAETFADYHFYYKPLALVSGDFYWLHQFACGTVLVMGDCTGHGIPGALMTMMVTSILDGIIDETNCQDTKNIVFKLDRQLSSILNGNKREGDAYIKHGLDLIVLFIDRQHKTIKLSSANMNLFLVKPLNSVEVIRGQRLYIGDGKIADKSKVRSVYLKYSSKCCYYMATDGIFEQIGGKKHLPYGYSRFKNLIFEHSAQGTKAAVNAVLKDFGEHMHGEIQRDDITLIGFRL